MYFWQSYYKLFEVFFSPPDEDSRQFMLDADKEEIEVLSPLQKWAIFLPLLYFCLGYFLKKN